MTLSGDKGPKNVNLCNAWYNKYVYLFIFFRKVYDPLCLLFVYF